MMKYLLTSFLFISLSAFGQPIKSGTYIFKYCDIEYNKCLSNCKVVVKGHSVSVYATKELAASITGTKNGDILEKGTLVKNKKGKWIIKNSNTKTQTGEDLLYIDFKKREIWRY